MRLSHEFLARTLKAPGASYPSAVDIAMSAGTVDFANQHVMFFKLALDGDSATIDEFSVSVTLGNPVGAGWFNDSGSERTASRAHSNTAHLKIDV